ncbi:MAG: DNA mismatch repair protein MutS [Fimbriimonadaceae bacterium]|nr:DNA mismatch repair protein MutS [Fimbriimonadaceae bacterium]
MKAQTPMMRQYFQAKEAHPGVLVAMRVGDFYEFYGEDAETAARALEITLTGREDGKNGRIAMAGVPFHSVERYLAKLIQAGFRVALCDQVEDPKTAKGLVRREVTRVLTPGTVVEDSLLSARADNFLAALIRLKDRFGLALLDSSTGVFLASEFTGSQADHAAAAELARVGAAEVVVPQGEPPLPESLFEALRAIVTTAQAPYADQAERRLLEHFGSKSLAGFGLDDRPAAMLAAAMALEYAKSNGLQLRHVDQIAYISTGDAVEIDPSTRRALELTQNATDGSTRLTLLSVLDRTVTSMGGRLLRRWVERPLRDRAVLDARHEAVARLVEHAVTRADLREQLEHVADIERLVGRAVSGLASPRDLAALRDSLLQLPEVAECARKVALGRLGELHQALGDHREIAHDLRQALVETPPNTLREGGIIRDGFDPPLDLLREKSRKGKDYIAQLEQTERKVTGIERLKVGYNGVFGYYLEVGKSHTDRVPDHYVRKQTTANAERYITAELKEHESAVLGADEKAAALEGDLFQMLRGKIVAQATALVATARAVAELDTLSGLAEVAVRSRFVRPTITDQRGLTIVEGRHPVVEAHSEAFVPNDLHFTDEHRLIVLTGPNMSGKSTYLRQIALIVVMAQIGSFVPAVSCELPLCDRIFARIGARDELALGQSTFMVEMVESANILNNATAQSLVILDEVGRGTSTYDGMAIAWAMVESLAELGSLTLFATHYHQLNALAEQVPAIQNFRIEVREVGDDVVWTHKVLAGGADKSYGLQVARMAGVPRPVVERAQSVLNELEQRPVTPIPVIQKPMQMSLFEIEASPVEKALAGLDVNELTPLEALTTLADWKKKFS